MLTTKQTDKLEKLAAEVMETLGYDLTDTSLKDTPRRIAKFQSEFFGYQDDNISTKFELTEVTDQMVVLEGIPFYSMCEHHMLPFFGTISIAYMPNKSVIGISKLARIAQLAAHKLHVQERLATEIADTLQDIIKSQDIGVYISAHHTCMSMRGIKSKGNMVTTVLRGSFKSDPDTKDEFLRYVLG
jgi:GTP cyclohydrolase I